ncbi:YidH family protein [Ornithinicoccus halotolerans]|uniref:YidH family protein n=1 Tax=Ornithinicoccus halotolerans TaxID=1748220 RepID=UPI0012956DA0|nr:DUF202 domain-containing protein [Ornithinicoccus halotolerans]
MSQQRASPGPPEGEQPPVDGRGRLARLLLPGGEEPDPRVTLANERTFLAWIRTAMALLAGGIALEAFAVDVFDEPARKAVAVMLIALGMLVSGGAFVRWVGVERAAREHQPIPVPLIAPVLGLGGALGAVVVGYYILRG